MNAQTFVLGSGETLKLDAPRGATVRVRSGDVWLTQHNDGQDHFLKTNHALALNGEGFTIITADEPTVLDLDRRDPFAVHQAVEYQTNRARSVDDRAVTAPQIDVGMTPLSRPHT